MGVCLINCKNNIEIRIGSSSKSGGRKCILTSKEDLIKLRDMDYVPIHIEENGYNYFNDWINSDDVIYEGTKTITEAIDEVVRELWLEFEDITFIENENKELVLSSDWHIWDKGTHISETWLWFEKNYSKGVLFLATIG